MEDPAFLVGGQCLYENGFDHLPRPWIGTEQGELLLDLLLHPLSQVCQREQRQLFLGLEIVLHRATGMPWPRQ
ncbi:hypothetical protein ITP53_14545 [Nonomuraea sp. K274]|uniref:Uncharacterized protein n=1 Tax=Nonomuraea cypriaca TaxID=1187855 RepID=A0A931EYW7_9ACTN|nr:hypothetical protein [Nonomuraea cypriaca]MBF8186937.1 hypothetical protein [Nonomuraea cypriaca]